MTLRYINSLLTLTLTYGRLKTYSLYPGHGERGSGLGVEPPVEVQGAEPRWGVRGQSPPPEAESSVAFEAPVEEPNLTLLTVYSYHIMSYHILFAQISKNYMKQYKSIREPDSKAPIETLTAAL